MSDSLGPAKGVLKLCPHHPEWLIAFNAEKKAIAAVLESRIRGIHHVGSTAVQGLLAKPVLDIAVELNRTEEAENCAKILEDLGYQSRILPELQERLFLSKGNPRTHHLHLFYPGSEQYLQMIQFRDLLNADPVLAKKYEELKVMLSKTHPRHGMQYARAKTGFILSSLSNSTNCEIN
jgi:GrpB-like predicted nucleotidyltransferase (UPF0157 family)